MFDWLFCVWWLSATLLLRSWSGFWLLLQAVVLLVLALLEVMLSLVVVLLLLFKDGVHETKGNPEWD